MRSPEERRFTGGSDLKYKVEVQIVREENRNLENALNMKFKRKHKKLWVDIKSIGLWEMH